jgi:hypothetical protein
VGARRSEPARPDFGLARGQSGINPVDKRADVLPHNLVTDRLDRGSGRLWTIVGVGYLSATAMNMAINPNIPRPILYGLLSSAYFLVSSILISVIIYVIH